MRHLLVGIFIFVCVCTGVVYLSLKISNEVQRSINKYEDPDTTITWHNGKIDTVIVKKQLPGWMR